MKRLILLVLVLLLTACNEEKAADPTTQPTVASSPLPPTITLAPLDTATPYERATLPPPVTLDTHDATPRPTRTLAASLTPAPTRTSVVSNVAITPVTEEPAPAENTTENPVVLITYQDLTDAFTDVSISGLDTLLENSILVSYLNDRELLLTFQVTPMNGSENEPIEATVTLFVNENGRLIVEFTNVYNALDQGDFYTDPLVDNLLQIFQDTLDQNLVNEVNAALGREAVFSVVNFTLTEEGISIDTTTE